MREEWEKGGRRRGKGKGEVVEEGMEGESSRKERYRGRKVSGRGRYMRGIG